MLFDSEAYVKNEHEVYTDTHTYSIMVNANQKDVYSPGQRQVIQLHAQKSTEMLEADDEHGVEAALE